jgi:exodeoxyribonuclease VII large subunit
VMKLMSPLNILKRGFAIVKQNDRICAHPEDLKTGDSVSVLMSSVKFGATIDNKTQRDATETDL